MAWNRSAVRISQKEDGTLDVDPIAAPVVKKIFEAVLQGHTRAEITRRVAMKHYKTESGRSISYAMINRLIKNELYTGRYHWGQLDVAGFCPVLVKRKLLKPSSVLLLRIPRPGETLLHMF